MGICVERPLTGGGYQGTPGGRSRNGSTCEIHSRWYPHEPIRPSLAVVLALSAEPENTDWVENDEAQGRAACTFPSPVNPWSQGADTPRATAHR